MFMKDRIIVLSLTLMLSTLIQAQTESSLWIEFADKKESNKLGEATLSDYSYAGYHFSEKEIPDVSDWTRFDVTTYGATPDDSIFDDDGIRAAIHAAIESNQPAVVYFPAGKFLVANSANADKPFIINANNIVLKGAGSGEGGTEIYTDQTYLNPSGSPIYPWRFHFKADLADIDEAITTINHRINRGDFTVEVADASELRVGQVVNLYHGGKENLEANMPGLSYKPEWVRIINNGIRTYEKHIIEAINGNKITFKNPVQYTMTADISGAELRKYYSIEEVGVEDILFTSGWSKHPEVYAHHASDFVDYAYRALAFENVKNGWIRNVEIRGWNESLMIDKSIGVTVKNLLVSGKQGHTSYFARYSYGILFDNCSDIVPVGFNNAGGQGHGPGMRWSTVNTVFLNCNMQEHQSIDCHGYHPYSNLLDNVSGGCFRGNGGAEIAYPNSGPYMTFWNFVHASNYNSFTYNFWDIVNRKLYTYINPIFVGFRSPGEKITFKNELVDELRDVEAYPKSLFDAQLQLRLYGAYMSASSSKDGFPPVNANDDKAETYWCSEQAGAGQWLMLDLGKAESVNKVTIDELNPGINEWKLEAFIDNEWKTIQTGTGVGTAKVIEFEKLDTRKLRFTIVGMKPGKESSPAEISDFKTTDDGGLVGITDPTQSNKKFVKIFPNPTHDEINLETNIQGEKFIEIYNSVGKKVWQAATTQQKIQLLKATELSSGFYIVQIYGEKNQVFTNKVILN